MSDVQSYSELNAYFWLKMAFICAAVLCGLVCLPQLHKHRQHPVLKYRTMSVYIMTIMMGYVMNILDLLKSEIPTMPVLAYRLICICYAISYSIFYGGVAAIGIRFHSLVLTRYVQGRLMDRRTCYDGVFYRRVASQIRWCRFLTHEKTAIRTHIVSSLVFCILLITPYIAASDTTIESVIQGQQSFLRMWLGSLILSFSIILLGMLY